MGNRSALFDGIAIAVTLLVIILSQWYVFLNPAYDVTTLIVGVVFPLIAGSIVLAVNGNRVILLAFLAYFWSLVDDAPVSFDSVFSWPEVTRFHPATPHIFLEIVLHALTAAFLILAIREALKGTTSNRMTILEVSSLTLIAFVLSYAQNIPSAVVQTIVESGWYQLDVVEHIASVLFLYFAVREARKLKAGFTADASA